MADQGPSIIPPFTKPVWPIRDQALLRSDESLQQPYLPHGNGDLKHARKRPTISHLFSFLCSHSNLTPMPVMSKLWWSERRVTNSSSCNSVALRSMAFCKRLHKCSCLEPLLQLVFLFCSLAGRFHLLLLTATSNHGNNTNNSAFVDLPTLVGCVPAAAPTSCVPTATQLPCLAGPNSCGVHAEPSSSLRAIVLSCVQWPFANGCTSALASSHCSS